MSNNPSISIIVPVLNEEGSLEIFYTETSKVLREYSDWEMIFVDDGSDDESFNIIGGSQKKTVMLPSFNFLKISEKQMPFLKDSTKPMGISSLQLMQTFRMTRLKSPD